MYVLILTALSVQHGVDAIEETIACTKTEDCLKLNDYFICDGPFPEEESGIDPIHIVERQAVSVEVGLVKVDRGCLIYLQVKY